MIRSVASARMVFSLISKISVRSVRQKVSVSSVILRTQVSVWFVNLGTVWIFKGNALKQNPEAVLSSIT